MMLRRGLIIILVFGFLPTMTRLSADTIELKTGERIEGAFRQATPAGAMIEVGGQSVTIPLEKVKAIYFGAAKPILSSPAHSAAVAPSADALDALKALRSVTQSGISYRDYAPRVLDAKVKVDKYLSSPVDGATDLRGAIGLAMREYNLASEAWSTVFTGSVPSAINVGNSLAGCGKTGV